MLIERIFGLFWIGLDLDFIIATLSIELSKIFNDNSQWKYYENNLTYSQEILEQIA